MNVLYATNDSLYFEYIWKFGNDRKIKVIIPINKRDLKKSKKEFGIYRGTLLKYKYDAIYYEIINAPDFAKKIDSLHKLFLYDLTRCAN